MWKRIPDNTRIISSIFLTGQPLTNSTRDGLQQFFIVEQPSYYFMTTPQTAQDNTLPDCVPAPVPLDGLGDGTMEYSSQRNQCSCCAPVGINFKPDFSNGQTRLGPHETTLDPASDTCQNHPDQLILEYTFEGFHLFVEVNYHTINPPSILGQQQDALCYGTVRTRTSFSELPTCDICRIDQFPHIGAGNQLFCGIRDDGAGNEVFVSCLPCFDFFQLGEEGFAVFDMKTMTCFAYIYDPQTGTYTKRPHNPNDLGGFN